MTADAGGRAATSVGAVEIRAARDEDARALAALRWDFRAEDDAEQPVVAFDEFVAHHAAFFHAGMRSGQRAHFVAELDGALIGHVMCQAIPLVPRPCRLDDACGMVTDNYVRPLHRGRGVGSAMLLRAIAWARARDMETIVVWPSERARGFYARHGFSERSEIMEMVLRGTLLP